MMVMVASLKSSVQITIVQNNTRAYQKNKAQLLSRFMKLDLSPNPMLDQYLVLNHQHALYPQKTAPGYR